MLFVVASLTCFQLCPVCRACDVHQAYITKVSLLNWLIGDNQPEVPHELILEAVLIMPVFLGLCCIFKSMCDWKWKSSAWRFPFCSMIIYFSSKSRGIYYYELLLFQSWSCCILCWHTEKRWCQFLLSSLYKIGLEIFKYIHFAAAEDVIGNLKYILNIWHSF